MSDISKTDSTSSSHSSSSSDTNLYGQVAGGWSVLASNLSVDSSGKLETNSSNLEKLASAGVLTRSSQGGFQLQVRLQEEKAVSADPVIKAGSPIKALIEDSVAQDTGKGPIDSTVVNALAQSPASPQGTISSPFMNSDSAAKLIFAMSAIFETESRVRKFTDQLYANLINQKFEQSYSQLSAVNQQYDAEKTRLLGAMAASDMAMIGALVSAGVGIAVTSASLMSAKRTEVDPEIQADSQLRDKNLKSSFTDKGKENPSQAASSLTLNPQEKETYLEAVARGDKTQVGSETARVPKSVRSEQTEEPEGANSTAKTEKSDAVIGQEPTAMRAGDSLIAPLTEQKTNTAASLQALDQELGTLEAKQKDLQLKAQQSAERGESAQASLAETRGLTRASDDKILTAHAQSQELFAVRETNQKHKDQLSSEGQRLQKELDALSTDLDPRQLQTQNQQLEQSKSVLTDKRITGKQDLDTSQNRVDQLQQESGRLRDERNELQQTGTDLRAQRADSLNRADQAQAALDSIGAKTLALLESNPKWQTSLGKSGGVSPNATFLNTNSVQFSSLKGGGIGSQKFAGELSRAHGRPGADGNREYNTWHSSVEKYLKGHGGTTAGDQKEAIASFNDAWKKGVDLNKVAEQLSAGGTMRTPAQLRSDKARASADVAQFDQALLEHQSKLTNVNDKLASAEQNLSAARFERDARAGQLAETDTALSTLDAQLKTVGDQRQQLSDISAMRDHLSDKIAQNQAQMASADRDLQSASDAFAAKGQELSDLQLSGQSLRVKADEQGTQVQSARLEQGQIESELASLENDLAAMRAKHAQLQKDQSDLEGQIAEAMRELPQPNATPQAVDAGISPIDASGTSSLRMIEEEQTPLLHDAASASSSAASASSSAASASSAPSSEITPASPREVASADGLDVAMKPVSAFSEVDQAAATRRDATTIDSKFKRHLGDFFQLLSNPQVLGLFREIGTRTGDIITQMGQIYKAQAGIAANDILRNAQTEQAYLETSEALLQQLITQTADDSKQVDKEMQNLLDVMKAISQSKTDMTRSLFLG